MIKMLNGLIVLVATCCLMGVAMIGIQVHNIIESRNETNTGKTYCAPNTLVKTFKYNDKLYAVCDENNFLTVKDKP